jgi:CubicO group peptidase (beta-lactamase class C family)
MELGDFIRQYFVHGGKFYTPINFSKVAPGKEFNYSNIAAALGAYLIELKSKMPFTEYTSEYIFKPLGMKDTHWFYDSSKKEQYAVLYEITKHHAPEYKWLLNADKSVKPYTDITYPDGKLYSSIEDMGKYLSAMIRGYSGNGGIISAKSFKILFSKNFDEDHPPGGLEKSEPNRAVFWAYDVNGNIVHTGSDYGLTTFISFNPISKTGHVLFFNTAFDGEDNEQPILHARKILKTIRSFEEAVK